MCYNIVNELTFVHSQEHMYIEKRLRFYAERLPARIATTILYSMEPNFYFQDQMYIEKRIKFYIHRPTVHTAILPSKRSYPCVIR